MQSVRMEQLDFHWTDFHEILCCGLFIKICHRSYGVFKIRQKYQALYMKTYIHYIFDIDICTFAIQKPGHFYWEVS
jgi:hypothetical protein